MAFAPNSLPWFATHELTLHWRELTGVFTRGGRRRTITVAFVFTIIAVIAHWIANLLLTPWIDAGIAVNITTLAQLTATGLLFAMMSLSQGMESVCRAYYTRADLDLILSSPASSRRLFVVRTGTIAVTSSALMLVLVSPFINILAFKDGPHWLAAYAVIIALSLVTTAIAIAITLFLFRTLGPKRTRVTSQILAAIIGAVLVVGIQLAIITRSGQVGAIRDFITNTLLSGAPATNDALWLPARATMGDLLALFILVSMAFAAFAIALSVSAPSFAKLATTASSLSDTKTSGDRVRAFRTLSPAAALRRKEWLLIKRDPWLISQSLMQLFYLLPPGVLLWMNFGGTGATLPIVVAILTMAAGQLAGGLAWITISGEDAHDFVATAPISPRRMLLAKVEAVVIVVACVTLPMLIGIAIASPAAALMAVLGVMLASVSAIFIQLMFRVRGRRAQFSRRHTASRIATLSEALVSITWAGATGLATVSLLIGGITALPALLVLLLIWLFRRNAHTQ